MKNMENLQRLVDTCSFDLKNTDLLLQIDVPVVTNVQRNRLIL